MSRRPKKYTLDGAESSADDPTPIAAERGGAWGIGAPVAILSDVTIRSPAAA